jgi:hypothetical protein
MAKKKTTPTWKMLVSIVGTGLVAKEDTAALLVL